MAAFTYSNNTGGTIVDLATISQTINVYGSTAPLTGVSVAILGLTHTFSGDLDMLLVAPNGTDNLVFWSDAGSVNDLNGVYIIQDGSTGLTELGMVPAGAYGPGAFSLGDPLETDATFGSSTGALNFAQTDGSATFASSFSGDPTGNWTIYIHDDTAADSGAFTGLQVIVGNAATTAQIDGTSGADSIVVTSIGAGAGLWNFNGDVVTFSGVTDGFTLNGGDGDDTITGGDDDDTISGGSGTVDTLDGGGGNNTLDYSASGAGVMVNLGNATASGGDASGDVISNFQNIIGSGFDDHLNGIAGVSNILQGGAGMDILVGLGGTNLLEGGPGADALVVLSLTPETMSVFDGGTENDTLVVLGPGATVDMRDDMLTSLERFLFESSSGSLVVQFNAAQFAFGEVEGQTDADVDTVEIFMDAQTVLDLSAVLVTNFSGDDSFRIFGDGDVETITGSSADDVIEGGAGGDTLDGGAHGTKGDTLSYASSTSGVDVALETGGASGGDAAGDTISGFENLTGSAHADALYGKIAGNNALDGGDSNDFLMGLGGTNHLIGGAGDDTLAIQVGLTEIGSTFDGDANFDEFLVGGPSGSEDLRDDTLLSIEKLRFTGDASDLVVQFNAAQFAFAEVDSGAHPGNLRTVEIFMDTQTLFDLSAVTVTGFVGGDTFRIYGDGDVETITGSSADDIIEGGAGGDTLSGGANGANGDTLSYAGSSAAVDVNLGGNSANLGDATGDVISGFENLIGSAHNDGLLGALGMDNRIEGGAGNDFIIGFGGTNALYGEAGDDTIAVQAGLTETNSIFDGGADFDELLIAGPSGSEDLRNDTITGIEKLRFSGEPSDFGVQFNADQFIFSQVESGAHPANSRLIEIFMDAQTVADFSGVTVTGFTALDTISILGDGDNETITGTQVDDEIDGAGGDDIIAGGAGADKLTGGANGAGGDTVSYAGSTAGVTVDLAAQTASGVGSHADGDTISGFENVIGSAFADALYGNYSGGIVNNHLVGGGGDDILAGYSGANVLEGGTGNDFLDVQTGLLLGNGTYDGGDDTDALRIFGSTGSVDFRGETLISLEELRFLGGSADYTVQFNAAQFGFDAISADAHPGVTRTIEIFMDTQSFANFSGVTVTGFVSTDTLLIHGDGDNETIYGTQGDDVIEGNGGVDILYGGAGDDTLTGGAAKDRLDGGPGLDVMSGGGADDIYTVSDTGDVVNENPGEGFDVVYAYANFTVDDNTEVLVLRGTATQGTGGAGLNRLYGSPVADTLNGMGGDDLIIGGGGGDSLIGGSGNDRLDGGPGNDTMTGGPNNDLYFVAQVGDVVVEQPGEGTDSIYTYVNYTASANVENLILRGTARVGTGNAEANSIAGTSGNDTLTGLAGNDRLFGKAGNDTLSGGENNDRLYGDRGQDSLTGGAGLDQFIFRETLDSSNQVAFADLITDFTQAEFDRIVLTDIDADETNGAGTNEAFSFIGTGAFTAPGQVRYEQVGGDTHVFGNTDADLFPEFAIVLTGTITLTSGDFFL